MNIVHCLYSFNTGGSESMLIDIVNEQVKTAAVTVIIINNSYDPSLLELFDKRIKVITLNRKPNSRFPWIVIKLNHLLAHIAPNVIHLHHLSIAALIMPVKSRGLFYTVHDLNISSKYSWRINKMFAISDAVARDMQTRAKCPIVTIPNGINTDIIQQRDANKSFDSFKIVQVARLDATKKGQDILIRALSVLAKRGIDNLSVDFIGIGFYIDDLKALAEELGVMSKIRFLGLQKRETVYKNLRKYDIMCHPARYEGFGLSVAEGMAAGLPVIVSDEGGPFEIIGKGKFGLAFKMENEVDLADKIQYMMQNYSAMLQIAEKAKRHVENMYSVKRMVAEYMKQYQIV